MMKVRRTIEGYCEGCRIWFYSSEFNQPCEHYCTECGDKLLITENKNFYAVEVGQFKYLVKQKDGYKRDCSSYKANIIELKREIKELKRVIKNLKRQPGNNDLTTLAIPCTTEINN
jgi:hypothetical protein